MIPTTGEGGVVVQRYWPGHLLVPALDLLRSQLMPDMSDTREYRRVELQLEQLPYCLGATSYALLELNQTAQATLQLSLATLPEGNGATVIRPYERERLGFLVDSVLEAARRAQNALVPYLRRRLKRRDLSKSLSKIADGIDTRGTQLPEGLSKVILEYWSAHGRRLKDYRDLSQHYAVVSSDVRIFRAEDGAGRIYLLLPNNPEVTSPSELRYESPHVHALPFLFEQFRALVKFTFDCCRELVDPSFQGPLLYGQSLKGALTVGAIPGTKVLSVEQLHEVLKRNLPALGEPLGLPSR